MSFHRKMKAWKLSLLIAEPGMTRKRALRMKLPAVILVGMVLTACGQGKDVNSLLQQGRADIDKARQVNSLIQQQAEKEKQEADRQTQ